MSDDITDRFTEVAQDTASDVVQRAVRLMHDAGCDQSNISQVVSLPPKLLVSEDGDIVFPDAASEIVARSLEFGTTAFPRVGLLTAIDLALQKELNSIADSL